MELRQTRGTQNKGGHGSSSSVVEDMTDEARVLFDIATLAEVDGEEVCAQKIRQAATYIIFLKGRVTELEERLEVYSAPNAEGETLYLGIGGTDGIGCRDDTIKLLEDRIRSLEEGECRFHCRVRADIWKAGGVYVWEHWQKLASPLAVHLDQMYKQWRDKYE